MSHLTNYVTPFETLCHADIYRARFPSSYNTLT